MSKLKFQSNSKYNQLIKKTKDKNEFEKDF